MAAVTFQSTPLVTSPRRTETLRRCLFLNRAFIQVKVTKTFGNMVLSKKNKKRKGIRLVKLVFMCMCTVQNDKLFFLHDFHGYRSNIFENEVGETVRFRLFLFIFVQNEGWGEFTTRTL